MNNEKFTAACDLILNHHTRAGIGTLKEKTLHAVLKNYYEPYTDNHEIKIGGYIADIVGEKGIIEIQTRNFYSIRKKLSAFLDVANVTIVFPIASTKWLIWQDTQTGETTKKRKSPKKGTPYEVFYELYQIKQFLTHPNFNLCIVMVDIQEYRNLNGWSHNKKQGSSRYERIPVNLVNEIYINGINDYIKLIPDGLPEHFTVKDYKTTSRLSLRSAGTALNVLNSIGAVKQVSKNGNAYVYERL